MKTNQVKNRWMNAGRITGMLVLAMMMSCITAQAQSTPMSWSGTWQVTGSWGTMELTQNGNKLTGTYTHENGQVSGTVSGKTFEGTWKQPGNNRSGNMQFILSADGMSFDIKWCYAGETNWNTGDKGTRISLSSYTGNQVYTGEWDVTGIGWGYMSLTQKGNTVSGAYNWMDGQISGTISNGIWRGTWTQPGNKRSGIFEAAMQGDGNKFMIRWRYDSNLNLGTDWHENEYGVRIMTSKLLTEGKHISYGINFDSGKDIVKPASYGAAKVIADILKENPNMRVRIIGHTDTDGNAANNLDLSKRRANAVKNYLVNEFKIDASRFETDGKGQTEPLASNNTEEGKAKNRRVEFLRINNPGGSNNAQTNSLSLEAMKKAVTDAGFNRGDFRLSNGYANHANQAVLQIKPKGGFDITRKIDGSNLNVINVLEFETEELAAKFVEHLTSGQAGLPLIAHRSGVFTVDIYKSKAADLETKLMEALKKAGWK